MKYSGMITLLLILSSFSTCAYSQLWKQYSDSADSFNVRKDFDKTVEYFAKAKVELMKDSAVTNTYARICNNLANAYTNLGQYQKAEPLYIEAGLIWEKTVGKEHSYYAIMCHNLARMYQLMREYEKAEPLYLEAKRIRENTLGKKDTAYTATCNNLAYLYGNTGKFKKAELLLAEAKKIQENKVGTHHSDYAKSCYNLAYLYWQMGQYEKAEPLYLEAKLVFEETSKKMDPDYAQVCHGLGILYYYKEQYEKAEPFYIEARQIFRNTLGKDHPRYASCCNNLANLYDAMGIAQYHKAEPLYIEAKQIWEKTPPGKKNPDYAIGCNNLGALYSEMGQYEKAEPLFLEAKQIREEVFGKMNLEYAGSCNNLASLYKNIGQYEKAETLYLETKQIVGKLSGKEEPEYASICDALAGLYSDTRQFEKAEPLYLEAKAIIKKKLGKKHPDYAGNCENLAELYFAMGQLEKAKPLYLEAKQIWGNTLGKENPDYSLSCNNLTRLYWNLGDYEKANDNCSESFKIQYKLIRKLFQFATESEQHSYLNKIADMERYFLSFKSSGYPASRQGLTYDVFLFSRNLILSHSQQLRQAIYNSGDTSVKNMYNSWIKAREELSSWYTKSNAERTEDVIGLEEKANTLEKELTRLSADFKKQMDQQESGWKNIQQSLSPAEAAIEFVEFEYYNGRRWTDSILYIALLIRKDKPEPQLIQLFEKKQLDKMISNTGSQAIDNKINTLYAGTSSLYDLIWKPLEKYLNGVSKVYFAPSGNLFKISFAALPISDKQALSDKYQLVQLNTTTTVTDNSQSFLNADDKIRLYGGVQYNADSVELRDAVKQYSSGNENSRSLPDDIVRNDNWSYLPGTEKEVSAIVDLGRQKNFSVQFSSGITATEESVKALSGIASPSVLHIATHGFFFPDPIAAKRDTIHQKLEGGGKAFKLSDNPFFRSGLVFAGANNAWQGKPIKDIEDGILTAYEVSNIYLPNTKLVVLSACETGLGDVQGNEGVYGLQRAFKMAGVQNLVMSLWRIGDRETAEFMQLFYKNLFDRQSVNDAFYSAQTIMKNKYRSEPYKWAAWILVK